MLKPLCRWVLYRVMGWQLHITEPHPDKYIICLAPHTSNWDFFIGMLFSRAEGLKSNFLMKREWFFWPLGGLFRSMGGIPVWRDKHTSMTDHLAATARQASTFRLCITPEGTRSPNPNWRMGFYFIAQKADMPILLYGIDYQRRTIECTKTIWPSGDVEGQMNEIKQYYKDFKGKKPQNFAM